MTPDDEKELETRAAIASVSLGSARRFQMRRKTQKKHQVRHSNSVIKISIRSPPYGKSEVLFVLVPTSDSYPAFQAALNPRSFPDNTACGAQIDFVLGGGSLFLMEGSTQEHWQHRVPKRSMKELRQEQQQHEQQEKQHTQRLFRVGSNISVEEKEKHDAAAECTRTGTGDAKRKRAPSRQRGDEVGKQATISSMWGDTKGSGRHNTREKLHRSSGDSCSREITQDVSEYSIEDRGNIPTEADARSDDCVNHPIAIGRINLTFRRLGDVP